MSRKTRLCLQPWDTINVGADGKVYPCCVAADDLIIGDLASSSLEEVLVGTALLGIREQLLTGKLRGACGGCQNAGMASVEEMHVALNDYLLLTAAQTNRRSRLLMLDADKDQLSLIGPLQVKQADHADIAGPLETYSSFSSLAFLEGRLDLGTDFTIGCWVRWQAQVESGMVFHYAQPHEGGWKGPVVELLALNTGKIQLAVSPNGYAQTFVLAADVADYARWTQVMVTKSGATTLLYINGVEAAGAETFAGTLHNPDAIARVGVNSHPARHSAFSGEIAALFIEQTGLDATVIKRLYENERAAFAGE